jgi:demethylspheroidene O-methyltransferase
MTLVGSLADSLAPAASAAEGEHRARPVQGSWRDSASAVRDRLTASRTFQRWAARIPGVRWIARRRARQVFDLVAGFAYTQTVAACLRVGLLALLRDEPLDDAAIAQRLALPAEGIQRLLHAAAALGLVERRSGGRWGLGFLGAPLLADAGLARMIEHNALLYEELRDPLALLRRPATRGANRGTALSDYWPYVDADRRAGLDAADVSRYSTLMTATVAPLADELLDAVPLHDARRLLDVGGGEGGFVTAAARRHPHLALALFDLPPVAERARAALDAAGLGARVAVHAGDFQRDALPGGADVVSLVRVCLDHDDATVRGLLERVREALPRGGRVLVAEPFAGVRGAEVVGDVYFGYYLWAMGRGRARRADELRALLSDAGFRRVRVRPTRYPVQAGVMVGTA